MNLRTLSTLQIALGVSVAVHAALLTVRIVDPHAFNRVFRDTPLEIILVNARTSERMDKAEVIAQASMAGGGEASSGRATSPLPSSPLNDSSEAMAEETQKRLQSLQQQQTLLLTQIKKQIASLAQPDSNEPSKTPEQVAREEKRRQLMKLLAEIELRINQENVRPKKRYISPSTREEVYAQYYDRLRRTIEDKGTANFPQSAGKKLYGELTMALTIQHDGRIVATEILESSGSNALDRRAITIARSAAPFARFNKAMRREADQLVVVSRFRFTRDETLQARVSSQ